MDAFDAALLDRLQNDLPLVERPWAALAELLEASEERVLERVRALRVEGIIRQVSAIFDTRRLGYQSLLVAAKVPEERQDEAAGVFSSHPGVTHNYLREHDFNIWFTLAVPPNSRIGVDRTIEILGDLAGVEAIRPLPALRFFKIGVDLDVQGGRDPAATLAPDVAVPLSRQHVREASIRCSSACAGRDDGAARSRGQYVNSVTIA